MKNGGKNKCVAFIILVSVYVFIYFTVSCCVYHYDKQCQS